MRVPFNLCPASCALHSKQSNFIQTPYVGYGTVVGLKPTNHFLIKKEYVMAEVVCTRKMPLGVGCHLYYLLLDSIHFYLISQSYGEPGCSTVARLDTHHRNQVINLLWMNAK